VELLPTTTTEEGKKKGLDKAPEGREKVERMMKKKNLRDLGERGGALLHDLRVKKKVRVGRDGVVAGNHS